MSHSIAEVRILEKFKEVKAMRIPETIVKYEHNYSKDNMSTSIQKITFLQIPCSLPKKK